GGRAAAGGIALINALANLGAFFGPLLVGWLAEEVHGYRPGLAALALTLAIGGTLALSVWPGRAGPRERHTLPAVRRSDIPGGGFGWARRSVGPGQRRRQ